MRYEYIECIPTVLIVSTRALRNTNHSLLGSECLSVSRNLRSSGPARHTSRLWRRDSGRWIRPAAADRDESSLRYHESSSSRLRTSHVIKMSSEITVVYDESNLSSDLQGIVGKW